MSLRLPPDPSDKDLDALRLLLPPELEVERAEDALLLTFWRVDLSRVPLCAFALKPRAGGDFSHPGLGSLVAELARRLTNARRRLQEEEGDPAARIAEITGATVDKTLRELLPGGEFSVAIERFHTRDEFKWFGPDLA